MPSCKQIIGFLLVVISSLIHIAVLPYADLVLLSSGAASAIVFGIILSVYILGEKFDLRYDLPGVLLTCTGCILTVLNANKIEQDYTLDLLQEYLLTPKSMLYVTISGLNIIASLVCLYLLDTWLPPF